MDAESRHRRITRFTDVVGTALVDGFHYLALFAIGFATAWSAFKAFLNMDASTASCCCR